jgi:PmbA protein
MADDRIAQTIDELVNLAAEVVERARARGADVAEAIARSGSHLSVKVRLGKPELVEEAGHKSIGMRVIKAGRVALTSTSDLTPRGVQRFVDDALELADICEVDPFAGPADPDLIHHGALPELELYDPATGEVSAAQALELARRGEEAARAADARITNSDGGSFSRTQGAFGLALSGGFRGGYAGSNASLAVIPLADDEGGKKRRGFHYTSKRFFADLDSPESVGIEAVRRTVAKLGARKVPTCEAPVVFDPDSARALLGLVAGAIMGGSIWRKSSFLCDKEGAAIASPLVNIVDDPLLVRALGSRPFDGEGLLSRRNVIVEQGVLQTYLCDSYSARKLSHRLTGSASRGGGGSVSGTTTNFILQPTKKPAAELVSEVSKGLYVTEMMGFGWNPVTGDFSRGAAGFWIEDGKLTFPVSEVTISLNMTELLQRIDAIGDDLDLRSSTASPTIRVSRMTIAGS